MIRGLLLALLAIATPVTAEWSTGGTAEVPLDGNGGGWLVHATVNGKVRGLFLLDTGATYCVVGPSTARKLGLAGGPQQAELRTANGTVRVPVVTLATIDVGGNRARDVTAVVHAAIDPPIDGIIGLSYLNNFRYAVDPRRRVLRLK